MFLIDGKRKARIKRLLLHDRACLSRKNFEFEVKVYRQYFHLFFIPFIPFGDKTVEIRCRHCGEPSRSEALQKEIRSATKTPVYFYSIPLIFAALVVFVITVNQIKQKEKAELVANPNVNDVYLIRRDSNSITTYSFLRIVRLSADTAFFYRNRLAYSGFTLKVRGDDYFVKEEKLVFTKEQLKQMLENGEINTVKRKYNEADGFNHIQ